jgi:hypothetical protein
MTTASKEWRNDETWATGTVAPKMTGRSWSTLPAHALTRTRRSIDEVLSPGRPAFSTRDLF